MTFPIYSPANLEADAGAIKQLETCMAGSVDEMNALAARVAELENR